MLLVVLPDKLVETSDVFLRPCTFSTFHLITLGEHKGDGYLKGTNKSNKQWKFSETFELHTSKAIKFTNNSSCVFNTLLRPSQLAQSTSIFCGGTLASTRSSTVTSASLFKKYPLVNVDQSVRAESEALANLS